MGKEMIGVDYQVAEVDSSFNGDKVEIVDPNLTFEEAANNFARRHCVPGKEILRKEKKLADDPIKAAQKVKIEGAPKDSDILIEASARVKIASDYLDQTPKQEEHFKGIRDNFSGLSGWFEGRGKIVKNIATAGLVAQMALTACNVKLPTPHPSETTPTEPPIVETVGIPTEAPTVISTDVPAGSETQVVTEAVVRQPVTAEDVRNIEQSLKLGINEAGNLTGLPENTSKDMDKAVRSFYDAIAEKFPGSTIYFDQDMDGSGQWILYAISPNGNLIHQVVSYTGGPDQFADYPFDYDYDEQTGEWKVTGNYVEINISKSTVGVIWKGLPQFLKDKTNLPSGDSVFTKYMEYKTYANEDPFLNVDGIDEAVLVQSENLFIEMTKEQMAERGLHGYGLEVNAKVEGLDTQYFIVTADSLITKMAEFGYGPLKLNSGMEKDESMPLTSAERIARMLRLGDYLGYMQDKGLDENSYTFDKYMEDLKNGEDRSYTIYYLKEKIIVDPMKPKELVFAYDLDFKNGFFNFRNGVNSQFGYLQNQDGGLRIINVLTQVILDGNIAEKIRELQKTDPILAIKIFPMQEMQILKTNLIPLSLSEEAQQGKPINGDPFYVNNIYDEIKLSTPARIEMVTLSQSPFATANPDNPRQDLNAFYVESLQ